MSALRLELSLPVLRLGLGPFSYDPLEQLVGAKLSDLLGPLLSGPVTQRRTGKGTEVEVFPLALREGEGATLPLGSLGELGVANEGGTLVLTVPALAAPLLVARLGPALLASPTSGRSLDGRSLVVQLRVRLAPGERTAFPLGAFGEMGLAAPP